MVSQTISRQCPAALLIKPLFVCTILNFRPSVRRRLESSVNMVPVMVHPSVRWWRRLKSPSTENTPAHSAARTPWSDHVSAFGHARDASESSLEVPGCTLPQPPHQWDPLSVVSAKWTKKPAFLLVYCDSKLKSKQRNKISAQLNHFKED